MPAAPKSRIAGQSVIPLVTADESPLLSPLPALPTKAFPGHSHGRE